MPRSYVEGGGGGEESEGSREGRAANGTFLFLRRVVKRPWRAFEFVEFAAPLARKEPPC